MAEAAVAVTAHLVHMAAMGLLTSVVAPLVVLASWDRVAWDRLALPAIVALPGFAVLHGTVLLTPAHGAGPLVGVTAHALVLLGAVVFWLPVLGARRRLPDPGRSAYLFLAGPVLDLPAVWLIAMGDSAGGLAMIVAMMPIGLAAIAVTWRWITREEELAGVN